MVVRPTVEVKAVKGDSLGADRNGHQLGPHLAIEAIAVHAEIARRIPKANETGRNCRHAR